MANRKNLRKEKIMKIAAKMFSERGYDAVTTREITSAVGINPAALYYYFPSKVDILKCLYDFYLSERKKIMPDLSELLRMAETETPQDVLKRMEIHYSGEIQELMDQILIIAAWSINNDEMSEQFIRESIFEDIDVTLRLLLRRLVDLGKVEPFDLDTFIRLLSYYCFSAAALNNTVFGSTIPDYQTGMSMLFSLLTPAGEYAEQPDTI
jgi:AcrR family transcriptional regulator